MRNPPERIAVPDSAHEVTEHIKMLLKAAGVGHQLPTPKSQILDCAQLVEAGELNLEEYKQTLSDKAHVFFRAISKILGLLDFNQHIVYVNPGVPASRKNFVTYHEVSHRVLPWHSVREISERDSRLPVASGCRSSLRGKVRRLISRHPEEVRRKESPPVFATCSKEDESSL